jgi:phage gpG-like protein
MPRTFQGPQLGKYGVDIGGVVEFYWVPDPVIISQRIMRVRDNLADRTIPLAVSRGVIARDVEENFDGEHDPQGQPWAPWSSAYHLEGHALAGQRKLGYMDPVTGRQSSEKLGYAERNKPGHSGKILNWYGDLKAAATDESRYVQMSGRSVNDDSLYFDTDGMPAYWVYHQEGTVKMPQRRFFGIGAEAEILVLEAFEDWFLGVLREAEVMETFTSSKGRTFARKRIPKGQPGAGRFAPLS